MTGGVPLGVIGALGIADQLKAAGVGIAHHFGGGVYTKETDIPQGASLAQHIHDHDHLSYLVSGEVVLTTDGVAQVLVGPCSILMEAGRLHGVHAVTDARWLCIWATDCTDPKRVDDALTGSTA